MIGKKVEIIEGSWRYDKGERKNIKSFEGTIMDKVRHCDSRVDERPVDFYLVETQSGFFTLVLPSEINKIVKAPVTYQTEPE